jgi:hypothetical protein
MKSMVNLAVFQYKKPTTALLISHGKDGMPEIAGILDDQVA